MDYGNLYGAIFQAAASQSGGNLQALKPYGIQGLDSFMNSGQNAIASFFNNYLTKHLQPELFQNSMRRHLTGAEREQNAFNAQQAQLQRDFAQSMFNQGVELENTSFQRQVNDMKQAGVNPAIMYGGAGSSGAGAPSTPSGVAASGSASAPADITGFTQLAYAGAQIRALNAQTSLVEAQTNKVRSETQGIDIDNVNKPAYWQNYLEYLGNNSKQAAASADKLLQEKETEVFKTAAAKAGVTTVELENDLLVWRNLMAEIDAEYYDAFQQINLRLANSSADLTDKQIEVANAQKAELLSRSIVERAQSKQLDAESWRLLKENGIIEDNIETYEQFIKSGWNITITDEGTRKLQNIVGAVGQAIGAGASVAGVFMLGKSMLKPKTAKIGYKP